MILAEGVGILAEGVRCVVLRGSRFGSLRMRILAVRSPRLLPKIPNGNFATGVRIARLRPGRVPATQQQQPYVFTGGTRLSPTSRVPVQARSKRLLLTVRGGGWPLWLKCTFSPKLTIEVSYRVALIATSWAILCTNSESSGRLRMT